MNDIIFYQSVYIYLFVQTFIADIAGAWRCHDILTVASGFLPSQEALIGFIDSSEMDIGLVASHLSSHGLLTPDDMEKVMTLPDLEGRRSAAVYMFACLYATYVDSLRGEWLMLPDYPEYTGPPAWLQTLLDTLGRYAGTNMQEELPNLQLSPGFWINIEGVFYLCLRMRLSCDFRKTCVSFYMCVFLPACLCVCEHAYLHICYAYVYVCVCVTQRKRKHEYLFVPVSLCEHGCVCDLCLCVCVPGHEYTALGFTIKEESKPF